MHAEYVQHNHKYITYLQNIYKKYDKLVVMINQSVENKGLTVLNKWWCNKPTDDFTHMLQNFSWIFIMGSEAMHWQWARS